MKTTCAVGLTLLIATRLMAAEYHVATNGSDLATGTLGAPFATVQRGVDELSPGDTLLVHQGSYREMVSFPVNGAAGNPITVKAFPHETVVVSGADVFSNAWTLHTNSIYKASISGQIRQLFINGKNTNEARWPNADPEDLVRMPRALLDDGSTSNMLVDAALPAGDWVGAIVQINPGSQYISYTRKVATYVAGSHLMVDVPLRSDTHYTPKTDNPYWLMGVYDALDTENEWFVNTNANQIFLWAPGGVNPDSLTIEIKQRDKAFDLEGRKYIEINGLDIFAGGVWMKDSQHCVIRNCRQTYVEHYREIRDHAFNTFSPHSEQNYLSGNDNAWINCEIRHSGSHGIYDNGGIRNQVLNCRISQVNYMAHRAGCIWSRNTTDCVYERNTFEESGKYAFFHREATRGIVRLNRMCAGGLLSGYDGGLCYGIDSGDGVQESYNWYHYYGFGPRQRYGCGIYWDGGSYGNLAHHNVVWDMFNSTIRCNKEGLPPAGLQHRYYNNTLLGTDLDPTATGYFIISAGGMDMTGTDFQNNLGEGMQGHSYTNFLQPDIFAENQLGVDADLLVQGRALFDFRLKSTATNAIDAAHVVPGYTDGYRGSAPDHGAYEYGSPEYWIPGRQLPQASVPIPFSGATNMPLERDLMYLVGYKGVQANICFGTASNALSFLVAQTAPTNVVATGTLLPGTTYFWRVDTVLEDSSVVTGEVWSFTTVDAAPPAAVVFSDDFEAYSAGSNPPASNWATQVEVGGGAIQVSDRDGKRVALIYNATINDRTVFGAVDAFAELGLMTISFDSFLDGATAVVGPLSLSAGVAACSSGKNQVRKVDIAANASTNAWEHFDWIVNQSGFTVNYYLDGGSYSVAAGRADLWRDGTRVVDNGTSVPADTEQVDTTPMDSFGWTINKANTADWRIDNVVIRDAAYVYVASPFDEWMDGFGVFGATNDPDNDGLDNLREFGLGGDPTNGALRGYVPTLSSSGIGFEYIYARRKNSGLNYWLETSTNLVSGIWTNSGYTEFSTVGTIDADFDAVTNQIPVALDETFIRLRIEEL